MTSTPAFYQQLRDRLDQGPVVVATIINTTGSAPREVGAKMAIGPDATIIGTIGGGAGEGKVMQQALALLQQGDRQWVDIDLTGATNRDIQGICGGKVRVWLQKWSGQAAIALVDQILRCFATGTVSTLVTPLSEKRLPYLLVKPIQTKQPNGRSERLRDRSQRDPDNFIEIIEPSPTLLIVGGGHVAVALARIAHLTGFQIAVYDDRPDFVTPQRFPEAQFLSASITAVLEQLASFSQTYIALVARGFQQDLVALQAILASPNAYQYIGAIGSQKRIRMIDRALRQRSAAIEKLTSFYGPIGLDIGALTPEEIAISICAELVKVRRGGTGLPLSQRMQLKTPNLAMPKVHLLSV
ncbi:MAG: XdhC family protein [Cyanobacteria bacterium P01_C01_bin.120]